MKDEKCENVDWWKTGKLKKKVPEKLADSMYQRWQPTLKKTTQGAWLYIGKHMSKIYCVFSAALGVCKQGNEAGTVS